MKSHAHSSAISKQPPLGTDLTSPAEQAAARLTDDELRAMPKSAYMNEAQLAFFRQRLLQMRDEISSRQPQAQALLQEHEVFSDLADQATAEEERALSLRLSEREALLIRKIDESLSRIRNGTYGYCTTTGEAIGIPRLLARPTASVSIRTKIRDEQLETHFRSR